MSREESHRRAGSREKSIITVEQKTCEVACTILASEPRVKVFLFGSRATGRAGSRSDIDLGIDLGHAIAPEVLAALRDAFDELPIMQKVDAGDCFGVDEACKAVALQQIASFYERQVASSLAAVGHRLRKTSQIEELALRLLAHLFTSEVDPGRKKRGSALRPRDYRSVQLDRHIRFTGVLLALSHLILCSQLPKHRRVSPV